MVADAQEMRRALTIFADPDYGVEVMALRSGVSHIRIGSDIDGLIDDVKSMPSGSGIYFRINPVIATLKKSAKNDEVVKRRWIYIDVDPVKEVGHEDDSATDAEKEATGGICNEVNEYLSAHDWPNPIVVDSGNGYGMFYRCDLPNDKATQAAVRQVLHKLSTTFSGNLGIIDKSVHNANRLAKLPGTWARKGRQSDDRPHRPCRIVMVPTELTPLTFEQICHAGAFEANEKKPEPRTFQAPTSGSAYARKAFDAECNRVVLARPGAEEGRNNALNRAAFSLGQLVAGGLLEQAEVEQRLYEAACVAGLDKDDGERSIRLTIESGMTAGKKQPRGIPEKNDPKAKFERSTATAKATADPNAALTVKMSRIKPQQVEWLIKDRIPKRFITVMAGRTGIGKSFVSFDLIARISTGGEIPFANGQRFKPGGTLIISEDSHDYVIAPRLIDAGADLDRINAMSWEAMAQYHLGDTEMLSKAVAEVEGGVSVVMIDPPTNFLEGIDEHKNSEVRQLVMHVVEWALNRDVAVLFILHVNKNAKGIEAINRVMGSVAWVTTSRIAHTFCPDPDDRDRGLWVPMKNNLGPIAKAIAYKIVQADGATRVEWCEEVDTNADDAMKQEAGPKKKRSVIAANWLAEQFSTKDELLSEIVWKAADETTMSKDALKQAKEDLGIKAKFVYDDDGNRKWWWYWPKEARACWQVANGQSGPEETLEAELPS